MHAAPGRSTGLHRSALALFTALALPAALLALPGRASAQPLSYRIDPELTRVHWEVLHFGTSTVRGRFDAVEGSVTLDRAAGQGSLSVSVATASVSSGVPVFDNVLRGAEVLAAREHPAAYFVANGIRFDGGQPAALRGEFTLRGVGRPLTLTALRFGCRATESGGERCAGDFEAELTRSDFGITFALPFVADRVRLLVSVSATRP